MTLPNAALLSAVLAARDVTERFHGVVLRARLTLALAHGATVVADDDAQLGAGWAERTSARVALLALRADGAKSGTQHVVFVLEADPGHVHPHLVGVGLCIMPSADGAFLIAQAALPASFRVPGAADWLLVGCWPV